MAPSAPGSSLSQRRRALGLSLLDLNRQTDLPLLYLMQVERGEVSPGAAAQRRLDAALKVGGWDGGPGLTAASEASESLPRPSTPASTAAAAEQFLRRLSRTPH
jgi:transcriptional regulator with XRE-family HTH domain